MKKNTLILIVLILLATLPACASNEVQIRAEDNGTVISIPENQILVVNLESNPTTGYSWQPVFDPQFLEQIGEPGFDPDSDLTGAGGVETFHFKSLQSGTTTLTLNYLRPWEENVAPEKVFEMTVVIE